MGRCSDAKDKLMEAVLELVWTGSYGTTSVDQICDRAGVKKGSFYHFFTSKAELTAAALNVYWEKTCRPAMDAIYSPSVEPLERIRKAAEEAVAEQMRKFEEYGHVLGCPLFSLGNEISALEQVVRDTVQKILGTQIRYLESALREATARGHIQCADPAFMAKALFLYWEGALTEARIKNDIHLLKNLWPSVQKLLGISDAKPRQTRSSRHKAA